MTKLWSKAKADKSRKKRKRSEIKFLPQLIRGRWKAKWCKQEGVHSMRFKVQTVSEQIGVLLENNSTNCLILPNYSLFIKCGKEIRLL